MCMCRGSGSMCVGDCVCICVCLNRLGRLHGGLSGRILTRWPQRGESWQRKTLSLLPGTLVFLKKKKQLNKQKQKSLCISPLSAAL